MKRYDWDRTGTEAFAECDALPRETASPNRRPPLQRNHAQPNRSAPVASTSTAPRKRPLRITRRHLNMVQAVIDGKRNKEIAEEFALSENTVKVYLANLSARLGVSGRHALAAWGRAYAEGQRKIQERLREMNPDHLEQEPTFEHLAIAEYDVMRAMALVNTQPLEKRRELAAMLLLEIL